MAWAGSTRHDRLPAGWNSIRAKVLRRDHGVCQIAGPHCTVRATDCDHITAGDDHSLGNLQAACRPCHQVKTIAERPRRPSERRPAERHPGLL